MRGLMMDWQLTIPKLVERAALLFPAKEIVTPHARADCTATPTPICARRRGAAGERAAGARRPAGRSRRHASPGTRTGTSSSTSACRRGAPCCTRSTSGSSPSRSPTSSTTPPTRCCSSTTRCVSPARAARGGAAVRARLRGDGRRPAARRARCGRSTATRTCWPPRRRRTTGPRSTSTTRPAMCYTSGTTGHPEGRRLQPPRAGAAVLRAVHGRCLRARARPTACCPWCRCSTPTPGACRTAPRWWARRRSTPACSRRRATSRSSSRTCASPSPRGVPTVLLGLLQVLEQESFDLSSLRARAVRRIGRAREPAGTLRRAGHQGRAGLGHDRDVAAGHGVACRAARWPTGAPNACAAVRAKQGMPLPGVEIRVVDDAGQPLPWDGKSVGELEVRGPWIAASYYDDPRSADAFHDGWFRTGDVVTIDADGYVQITDRAKDVIKSGGEWISSVELENLIIGHPDVLEAAVIGLPHERWQERPLACVVPKPGQHRHPGGHPGVPRAQGRALVAAGGRRLRRDACPRRASASWRSATCASSSRATAGPGDPVVATSCHEPGDSELQGRGRGAGRRRGRRGPRRGGRRGGALSWWWRRRPPRQRRRRRTRRRRAAPCSRRSTAGSGARGCRCRSRCRRSARTRP